MHGMDRKNNNNNRPAKQHPYLRATNADSFKETLKEAIVRTTTYILSHRVDECVCLCE